jgi:hypothetical protein
VSPVVTATSIGMLVVAAASSFICLENMFHKARVDVMATAAITTLASPMCELLRPLLGIGLLSML